MVLDPSALLDDALRLALQAHVPAAAACPVEEGEMIRWRGLLKFEADRLASDQYPLDAVEPLRIAGAAFESTFIRVEGSDLPPGDGWAFVAPITKRLLPKAGFAHAFAQPVSAANPLRGAVLHVPFAHKVKLLHDRWFQASARYKGAVEHSKQAYTDLISEALTLRDVLAAWPEVESLLENQRDPEQARRERLADAARRVADHRRSRIDTFRTLGSPLDGVLPAADMQEAASGILDAGKAT